MPFIKCHDFVYTLSQYIVLSFCINYFRLFSSYVLHHIREDKILYESLGSLIEDVVYHLNFINERFH